MTKTISHPVNAEDLIRHTSIRITEGDILSACQYYRQYRKEFNDESALKTVDRMMVRLCRPNSKTVAIPQQDQLKQSDDLIINRPSRYDRYLISVLIIAERRDQPLQAIIEQLLQQSVEQSFEEQPLAGALEILVADATETAAFDALIASYQDQHNNIAYLAAAPSRNHQRFGILNRLIGIARGDTLTLATPTQTFAPGALHTLVATLNTHPQAALIYPDTWIVAPGASPATAPPIALFRGYPFEPRRLFELCYVGPLVVWRRALHQTLGGFDPSFQDAGFYDFWLRAAVAGEYFIHWPHPAGTAAFDQPTSLLIEESKRACQTNWPNSQGPLPLTEGSCLMSLDWHPILSLKEHNLPLVSIIIPTFNRPAMLLRAVESLLQQRYPRVEGIIVNDGGEDVAELLNSHFSHANLTLINLNQRHERSHARNVGIRRARGQYLGYLDDDDFLYPDHIETLA